MLPSVPGQIQRASQHNIRMDNDSAFLIKATSSQKSRKSILNSVAANPTVGDLVPNDPSQTGLTPEACEEILAQEYGGPLTPWVARKLRFEYGVRDWSIPGLPGQWLQIVTPIAEELVHDTIVDLWLKIKEKNVELQNKTDVRRWLMGALKISLRRWAQRDARASQLFVYPRQGDDPDSMDGLYEGKWLDLIGNGEGGGAGGEVEDLSLHGDQATDEPDSPVDQATIPSDELNAAMEHLPSGIQTTVNHVYGENVSWQQASAPLNVNSKSLERDVQGWLHTLRPHIPSYQPSHPPVRADTRRVRKSFHCPACDTAVKRKEGGHGAVCPGCRIGIHKDLFAIKYTYRHA